MRLFIKLLLFSALCFCAVNRSAFAFDWSFTPSATLSQSYDSNFRFLATPPPPGSTKGDYITSFSPVVSVTGANEETIFQFDTTTSAQSYVLNPKFDIINTNTTASLTESWSPVFSTSANFGFVHDSTLEDQLLTSGIVTQKVERFVYIGGLGAQYALNESVNLVVSSSVVDTIYPSGTLPGSDVYQGTITPIWTITPRDSIGLTSNYSYTDYSNATVVKTLTEMLYWQRDLTETLNVKLSGGYYFTTIDYILPTVAFIPLPPHLVNLPETSQSSNPVYGVDVKKDWSERFSTTFSAAEQEYNDVNARSFNSTSISGTASYKLSELTTFNFTARYNMNDQVSQGGEKIDYYIINPAIERNLTENLLVRLSGSYENESDSNYGGVAGKNIVYDRYRTWVDLTYKWPRFLASH